MMFWVETTYSHQVSFVYVVTSDGAINFDNRQESACFLDVVPVRDALSKEMLSTARNQVKGALYLRTVAGISSELDLHYKAYRIGFLSGSTWETNIGGMKRSGKGSDRNAFLFEFFFAF